MNIKGSHLKQVVIVGAIMVALVAGAFLAPVVQAAAPGQAGTPPAPQNQAPQNSGETAAQRASRLENRFQSEQKWLQAQQSRLDQLNTRAGKVETLIEGLKGKGLDTSLLETALADFKAALASATTMHQDAAGVLNTHAGFDANGKVTDAQQAQMTIQAAGQSLQEARQTLNKATRDLVKDMRQFRRDQKAISASK